MAKRFTDTDKWKKKFIRGLKTEYKLFWLYLTDDCDNAGIWEVDIEIAEIKIGESLNAAEAIEAFTGKIHIFDGGKKWFIPSFVEFQYKNLCPKNKAHSSVIEKLRSYGLYEFYISWLAENKLLASPLEGAMDMVKDKDMELDKDKEKEKEEDGENSKIDVSHETFDESFDQLKAFDQFFPLFPNQIERITAFKAFCQYAINASVLEKMIIGRDIYAKHLKNNPRKMKMSCHNWIPKYLDWVNHIEPDSPEEIKKAKAEEYRKAEEERRRKEAEERARIAAELDNPEAMEKQRLEMEKWYRDHPKPESAIL